MKTSIESPSDFERKLLVEVPSQDVDSEFNKAFKYLQKSVEIKGFRKGKAPLEKIRLLYGEKVRQEVSQNLVQSSFYKAIGEHSLMPIGMPDFEFVEGDATEGQFFSYSVQIQIQPPIPSAKYEGLEVEKEKIIVTDQQVEDMLLKIQEQNSVMEDVKLIREISEKDHACIDFTGYVDDKLLEGGSATDHTLEIGSNSFIPGFEEGLIGLKPQETKSLHLSFPDDYHVENLKGKKVRFDILVKGIKKKTVPDLNDAFAKTVGNFESFNDFKEEVRKNITKEQESRVEGDLKSDLFQALVDANPFEVSPKMVDEQRTLLVDDFRQRMSSQGMTPEDFAEYQDKWSSDFSKTATNMVKSSLLIQQLSKENNLVASQEEVNNRLQAVANQTGLPISQVQEFYNQDGKIANLQFQITEDKVFQFILKSAKVTEVEPKAENLDEDTDKKELSEEKA